MDGAAIHVKKSRHSWTNLNKQLLIRIVQEQDSGKFARGLADPAVSKQKEWVYFRT
jgi:hypothetical protein